MLSALLRWAQMSTRASDRAVRWVADLPPRRAWALTLGALALTALGDHATGRGFWFGPIYLVLICLPTWAIGERAGFLTGALAAAMTLALNGAVAYPDSGQALVWSVAIRLLSVVLVVMLVGAIRRSYRREWTEARVDRLTGAITREALLERVNGAGAGGGALLAYIDLDGFKQVNDRHGHGAGDAVLREFVQGVMVEIRRGDSFARIGGDEFLLHLPLDDANRAHRTAEKLHARLNAVLAEMPHRLGCSMGALFLPKGAMLDARMIDAADRLMYTAKRAGGSRFRFARPGALGEMLAPSKPRQTVAGWSGPRAVA